MRDRKQTICRERLGRVHLTAWSVGDRGDLERVWNVAEESRKMLHSLLTNHPSRLVDGEGSRASDSARGDVQRGQRKKARAAVFR